MSNNGLCRGTKENPTQACPAMRSNNYEINIALFGDPNNFGSSVAMHNKFLNLKTSAIIAFGKFWEFALR